MKRYFEVFVLVAAMLAGDPAEGQYCGASTPTVGAAGFGPTGYQLDPIDNCPEVGLPCGQPEIDGVRYVLDDPMCDLRAEVGTCTVRATLAARVPGNHQLPSNSHFRFFWFSSGDVGYCSPDILPPFYNCSASLINACGFPGSEAIEDHGDAYLVIPGFSCINPAIPANVSGTYSAHFQSCFTSSAGTCRKKAKSDAIVVDAAAIAAQLCQEPPEQSCCDQNDCSTCIGVSGGGGSGSGGGAPAGGGGAGSGGGGTGPEALLFYKAGGVGHADFPGTAEWTQSLGRYWAHSYAERIVEVVPTAYSNEAWLLTDHAVFIHWIDDDGDGAYEIVSPADDYRTLTKTGGGWTLADLEGTVDVFDTQGRWLSTTDRFGNAKTATYDMGTGKLNQVVFPDGRRETFAYSPTSGRLETITESGVADADSLEWAYTWGGFDDLDLVRVDRPDGTALIYEYDDTAWPGYLTGVRLEGDDDVSQRIEKRWEYDSYGNVVAIWRGAENKGDSEAVDLWELSFDDPALPEVVTATDPLGRPVTYTLSTRSKRSEKPKLISVSGDCPTSCSGDNLSRTYADGSNPFRATAITDGEGVDAVLSYDANGMLTSLIEDSGGTNERETTWQYHPTYPALVTQMQQLSTNGGPTDYRNATFAYDGQGALDTVTEDGFERGMSYTALFGGPLVTDYAPTAEGLTASVDAPGHGSADEVSYTYDPARGSLLPDTRTDPLIGTTGFGYDAFDRLTTITDPNGVTATTTYDELDRVTSLTQEGATDPEDLVTARVYNTFGDLKRFVLPRGNVIEFGYDAAGRLTSIERKPDAAPESHGELLEYALNAAGQRTFETRSRWEMGAWAEKSRTEFVYSSRCHLDRRIDGSGSLQESITEYEYDCNGNLARVWDPNHPKPADPTTVYEYDSLERLIRVTQPNGSTFPGAPSTIETIYGYDVQDHLTTVTDPEGTVSTYTYSDRDLLTGWDSEVSGATSYTYGEHGRLHTRTDARGVTATYGVDVLNRVVSVDWPGSTQDIVNTYDDPLVAFSLGRLTQISRGDHDVDMEYDRFGRQIQDGDLTYSYDVNSNRDSVTYPDGSVANFTFDFADRPLTASLTPTGQGVVSLVSDTRYLPGGPADHVELGNSLTETRPYDERYHPAGITVGGLLDWSYTIDSVGNVEGVADLLQGAAFDRDYDYQDVQYYLTGADGPWGTLDWTYDEAGSRLSESRDGATPDAYTYVPNQGMSGNTALLDEILIAGGPATRTYGYDTSGNQTAISEAGDGVVRTYDEAGRLTSQDRASAQAEAAFLYDGRTFLREARGSSPAGTAGVFCDGFESGDTSEWGGSGSSCFETRQVESTYGSGGMLYSVGGSGGTRNVVYFGTRPVATWDQENGVLLLTSDHLGTPILATDETGALAWSGGFEAFGADWQSGTSLGAAENGVFLRFPGQWGDPAWSGASLTSDLYNLHRWYSPDSGNYTRPDPLEEMLATVDMLTLIEDPIGSAGVKSTFLYAGGNPLRATDPTGLGFKVECGGGCTAIITTDPVKGKHAHWWCPGRSGCVLFGGGICDKLTSAPPTTRIKKCLRKYGFQLCEITDPLPDLPPLVAQPELEPQVLVPAIIVVGVVTTAVLCPECFIIGGLLGGGFGS